MIKSHLKFFIRVFLKDKFSSILNILGLALGIAVGIVLLLILQNDFTYDENYVNHERIFRLGAHYQIPGTDTNTGATARELGPILKDEFPEIQELVRIKIFDHSLVKQNSTGYEKAFYEENVIQADSSYFKVFSHKFIAGNPRLCLSDPHNVVITQTTAVKYFGLNDPLNKLLLVNDESWKVAGVIRDLPENTHLKFDILLSGLPDHREWTIKNGKPVSLAFWNPDVHTYLLLPEHYDPKNFHSRFQPIYNRFFKETGDQLGGHNTPILQHLTDIHFSKFDDDEPHGSLTYLYAFSGIGCMIILLACINYMNLSNAKAVNRATEVSIKKILGSGKLALIFSILGESILLSMISFVVAIVLVFLSLNSTSLNQLIGKNLTPNFMDNPVLFLGSVGITFCIGLISGLYPAFYLPAFPAISALKGRFKNVKSNRLLRKALITTQFAISIFVVVCTLFMRNQIDYMQNKDLGFNKNNVLVVPIKDNTVHQSLQAIRNELARDPHISSTTGSRSVIGMGIGGNVMFGESETGMH